MDTVTPKNLRTLAAVLRSSVGEQLVDTPEHRATLADWINAAAEFRRCDYPACGPCPLNTPACANPPDTAPDEVDEVQE